MKRYNPNQIEPKWQKIWEENKTYQVDLKDTTKPKFFGFAMLPYPSGTGLHTGHVRTYTLADVTVRAKRQQGFNAYNPIGWDAFGLPAENYAIKTGTPPKVTTDKAIARFKEQLSRMGMSHDWSKQINTSDPEYYRWTQWIFKKLFEHGLAYQKESLQWWCEADQTVLANEQVVGGKCWRHDGPNDPLVTKKALKQWFFKITDYADELLNATDDLEWPDFIKTMQKNWIGRSVGAEIDFKIESSDRTIKVFTTRPDTIFGATFVVLAPEHPLANRIAVANKQSEVSQYIKKAQAKTDVERQETDREKTGVFSGAYAVNPATKQKIPIWIADYVLANYGTGAIMAVPAHDERDYQFATKFKLAIKRVVDPVVIRPDVANTVDFVKKEKIVAIVENAKDEILCIHWRPELAGPLFVGGTVESGEKPEQTAIREIREETGYIDLEVLEIGEETFYYNYFAHSKNVATRAATAFVHLKLKSDKQIDQMLEEDEKAKFTVEWISRDLARQIDEPLHKYAFDKFIDKKIFSGEGVLVDSGAYNNLPTSQAREKIVADLTKQGAGKEKVNYKIRDWLISRQRYWGAPIPIVHCPTDGAQPVPDDQLPLKLPEINDFKSAADGRSPLARLHNWVDTTCPKCGKPAKRETDTMDGYACSSWYFLRYLDPKNSHQAWDPKIINNWMPIDFYNGADHAVSHLLYARFWTRFFNKLGLVNTPEPVKRLVYNAYILASDGAKMSKSKGNVVDPLQIVESGYGADALRVYEMFIAPYDQEAPWDDKGVPGTYRFLRRVWDITQEHLLAKKDNQTNAELRVLTNKTIKKVTNDIQAVKFNTAVSAMMELVNFMYKNKTDGLVGGADWRFAIESLLQLLAPFAPHITDELWQQFGHSNSIHIGGWPVWDEGALKSDSLTIVVQVNGKLRASLQLSADATRQQIETAALVDSRIKKITAGKQPQKLIYVPGKLINIVV